MEVLDQELVLFPAIRFIDVTKNEELTQRVTEKHGEPQRQSSLKLIRRSLIALRSIRNDIWLNQC